MIRALVKEEQRTDNEVKIPDYLIKEEIDGIPYFYKGYKAVLNNKKTLEDIMGASGLQSLIVEVLMRYLIVNLDRKKYRVFTNEGGNHLKKGTNLSFDVAIYDKKVLTYDKINEYYVNVPPKVVLEIDVKIEIENQNAIEYINTKTEKLLNYGTELVLWILTKNKKIILALPNKEWQIINWNKDISLIDDLVLNLNSLIEEEEQMN